jgi:cellulose synthase/poly-beta-1,6-N-acetylglucosamine synthase-like glycosyltransferase
MVLLFTGIACLLFIAYVALIVRYERVWKGIPDFVPWHSAATHPAGPIPGTRPSATTRITVLIPARNEEATIRDCLQSLAGQSYPRELFEVIVLDDHSADRTAAAVDAFAAQGVLNLRCLRIADMPLPPGFTAFKKFAIETGVGVASGELIVTTDADCFFDPHWLSTLAACYETNDAKFIAAPVRIGGVAAHLSSPAAHRVRLPHSLLGIFQTLDFITLQGITGAAVHSGFHSMCNGANLAYAREAFYAADGFRGIDHIPSGDDMLLMHKIYLLYPGKVFFLKSRQAIVSTRPETRWKGFLHQRVRWASKADSYEDRRIFWVLLGVYLVNVLFVLLLAGAFFNAWWLWLFLVLLVAKTVVEYPFVRSVATFFGQQELMVYFPALQPLHILYTVIVGWLGKFGSYSWKDRTIKK